MLSIFKVASKFEKKIAAANLISALVGPVGQLLKSTGQIKQQSIKDFERALQQADKALRAEMQTRALEDRSIKDPTYGLLRSPATSYISSDLDNALAQQLKKLVIDSFGYCRKYYAYALPKNPADNLQLIVSIVDAHQSALNKLNELSEETWVEKFSNINYGTKFFTDKLNKGLLAAKTIQKIVESAQQGVAGQAPSPSKSQPIQQKNPQFDHLVSLVNKAKAAAMDMQDKINPLLDKSVDYLVSYLRTFDYKTKNGTLSAGDIVEAQKRLELILKDQAAKKLDSGKVQAMQYYDIDESLKQLLKIV